MPLRSRSAGAPSGFRSLCEGKATGWVREGSVEWVLEALRAHGSLYEAARVESGGVTPFRGRAPVFILRRGSLEYAVRRYTRGGAMGPLLGTRYLRVGAPRPLTEILISESLRSAGIATPRALAGIAYSSGVFYRGEMVTERVTEASDLGERLFERRGVGLTDDSRIRLLAEAGALIRRLAEAGVYHPDLNVKNLLARDTPIDRRLYLLDLDRCRIRDRPRIEDLEAMSRRLQSSLRKWGRGRGRALRPPEWEALRRATIAS